MTDTFGFSVGAVARRLGVAPSTLRTWNRRYGIGARELSPGKHRRYTAEDIIRLEYMQKLILRGVAPADAARAAITAPVAAVPAVPRGDGGAAGGDAVAGPASDAAAGGQATAVLVPGQAEARPGANGHDTGMYPGEGPLAPRPGPGHGSGGQRLALPGASAAARGLARAALALDERRISETIRAALVRDGSVRTWEELLVPVLSGLGTRFEHTGTCVEPEHLLSVVVIAEFSRRTADLPGRVQHRAVLLASAEDERHSLPLHALAAALAERGIDSRVLGPDLPYFALAAAVRRTGPGVVFLWSQAAGHRRPGHAARPVPAPPGRAADPRRPGLGPGPDSGPGPARGHPARRPDRGRGGPGLLSSPRPAGRREAQGPLVLSPGG